LNKVVGHFNIGMMLIEVTNFSPDLQGLDDAWLAVVVKKVVHPHYLLMNLKNFMRMGALGFGIILCSVNSIVPGSQLPLVSCPVCGEGAPYMS
jgi:hypothetical protein